MPDTTTAVTQATWRRPDKNNQGSTVALCNHPHDFMPCTNKGWILSHGQGSIGNSYYLVHFFFRACLNVRLVLHLKSCCLSWEAISSYNILIPEISFFFFEHVKHVILNYCLNSSRSYIAELNSIMYYWRQADIWNLSRDSQTLIECKRIALT